jgi:hypothetical protein
MMRRLSFTAIFTMALLVGSASAAVHEPTRRTPAQPPARDVAHRQLDKPIPSDARLFSNVMLDPARCNYEYVELHGASIVRTELRLTCTTHR